jgi:hypothetical protein
MMQLDADEDIVKGQNMRCAHIVRKRVRGIPTNAYIHVHTHTWEDI